MITVNPPVTGLDFDDVVLIAGGQTRWLIKGFFRRGQEGPVFAALVTERGYAHTTTDVDRLILVESRTPTPVGIEELGSS